MFRRRCTSRTLFRDSGRFERTLAPTLGALSALHVECFADDAHLERSFETLGALSAHSRRHYALGARCTLHGLPTVHISHALSRLWAL
eukprot:2370695-Pleurochrysis_carterae.AAC.1